MFYVLSYDISSDKNRAMVFKIMKKYGLRVQYSVFEGELTKTQLKDMMRDAKKFIDNKSDSLRIYSLCASCRDNIKIIGQGEASRFPPAVVV